MSQVQCPMFAKVHHREARQVFQRTIIENVVVADTRPMKASNINAPDMLKQWLTYRKVRKAKLIA